MVLLLHLRAAGITIVLFIARFYLLCIESSVMNGCRMRIVPHINDTLLLITGVMLVLITRFYPLTPQGSWQTVKIAGVFIYIVSGSVALSRRTRTTCQRRVAFVMALLMLAAIVALALIRMPIPGIV